MSVDVEHFREVLITRKTELLAAMEKYDASLARERSRGFAEGAVERENDEVIEGLGLSGQSELHLINAALERVAAGRYGICAMCGEEILPARLAIVPHAALCRNCA